MEDDELKSEESFHFSSKTDQTVSKFFAKFGLDNPEVLCEHDVKIVEFTATPNGLAYDIAKWNDSHLNRAELITMAPGPTYVGAKQLKCHQRKFFSPKIKTESCNVLHFTFYMYVLLLPYLFILNVHLLLLVLPPVTQEGILFYTQLLHTFPLVTPHICPHMWTALL